jgi:uncharacterized coiled-coil protein SlyX
MQVWQLAIKSYEQEARIGELETQLALANKALISLGAGE